MKYFLVLLLLFFIIPGVSNAQNNYVAGYIVTPNTDTLRCMIDYQEWNYNPAVIKYKLAGNTKILNINPDGCRGFGIIGGESYESFLGPISMDYVDAAHITELDTSYQIKSVFLKIIQTGPNLTLYSYSDKNKTRFFVKETGASSKPYELIYKVYFKNSVTVTDNTFIQQLMADAAKYNVTDVKAINFIEKSEYNINDLTKSSLFINHFQKQEFIRENNKSAIQIFAGAGVSAGFFTTNSTHNAGTLNNSSVFPKISAGVDFPINPHIGKLIFRIEFIVTANKYEKNFSDIVSPYNPLHYNFTIISTSFIPQVVYNFYNTKELKLYLSPGLQATNLNYTNERYYQIFQGNNLTVDPGMNFVSLLITPFIKAGVKINNKVDVSINYIPTGLITNSAYTEVKVSYFQGGLNYYF